MITALSWNLNGLEEHRLDERMEAACLRLLLRPEPPTIVLLQEIVDRALTAHLRPHFGHAGYAAAIQPATGEYYVGAFVRAPLRLVGAELRPFERSPHGRALLELAVVEGPLTWRIATAHLESGPTAGPERTDQLAAVLGRLADHDGPALFAGDTNLREAEGADLPAAHGATDAWVAAGSPHDARGTWRPPSGRGRTGWFRFDRCYVNERVRIERFATSTADTELDPVPASDHLAIEISAVGR